MLCNYHQQTIFSYAFFVGVFRIKYQSSDLTKVNEPQHEISNKMACLTSKASDQPAHMRSLIRTSASHWNIL